MLPRVILYNAVSVDGCVGGFPVDIGRFYELASFWKEDATLAGSDTILQAFAETPHNGAKVLDVFLDSHPEVPKDLHVESNTSPGAKDTEGILAHWRVLPSASGDN